MCKVRVSSYCRSSVSQIHLCPERGGGGEKIPAGQRSTETGYSEGSISGSVLGA